MIDTNGGPKTFENEANLILLPLKVYYNESSLSTILSMKDMANIPGTWITLDTDIDRAMIVHLSNGVILRFAEHTSGLYV